MKKTIQNRPEEESRTELRQRAEKEQASRMRGRGELTPADKDNLLYELEVHQIELEMQNEDLRRAQQEAQESRNRYLDLFDFAPVGYFVLDPHFLILEANLTGSRMLGMERSKLSGQRFTRFIDRSDQDVFQLYIKDQRANPEESCEIGLEHKEGSPLFVQVKSVAVASDRKTHYRVTLTDITRRKQAEESVRRLNESLSRSAADLAISNKELKDMEFAIVQDLKAGLRQISGFSQAILDNYAAILDKPATDYLERIRSISQAMGRYQDDLLSLSNVTAVRMSYEKVNLSSIVENIAMKLKNAQMERPIELKIEPGLTVTGDYQLLHMALEKLLENAFKFTARRSPARIEFGHTQQNGQATYFVRDNGIGFNMKYADKLFIPFQHLHSQKEFPGDAISLPIVQRIIHRLGGKIWAEAETGKGATFYFTLSPRMNSNAPQT